MYNIDVQSCVQLEKISRTLLYKTVLQLSSLRNDRVRTVDAMQQVCNYNKTRKCVVNIIIFAIKFELNLCPGEQYITMRIRAYLFLLKKTYIE